MEKETLDRILGLLGPTEESAAIEYRKLHQRLSRFFEWNGVNDPPGLADEAIDRLGKRILEHDAQGEIRKPFAFVLGIARFLLQEEARDEPKRIEAIRQWKSLRHSSSSEAEIMDRTLQHCLGKMPPDRRALLTAYYNHSGSEKVKSHHAMAQELGITVNALRNRALRARQELEICMRNFLKKFNE